MADAKPAQALYSGKLAAVIAKNRLHYIGDVTTSLRGHNRGVETLRAQRVGVFR